MRILLLGTFEVLDAKSQPVPLGARMMPLLLARLALNPQTPVSADTLLHDLWDGVPPAGGVDTLRRLASRTRSRLRDYGLDIGPVSDAQGFKLDLAATEIDAFQFEHYTRHGVQALSTGQPHRAVELFDEALRLWRSTPLADITADFAEYESQRLVEVHRLVVENQLAARAHLGETTTLIADLQAFCQANPTREHSHVLYLRLLATMGERAEALRLYERLRRNLRRELGTDPSVELQALHAELLRDNPAVVVRPAVTKAYLTTFFGRETELEAISQSFTRTRLVSVVGSGGIGKTRLAAEYIAHNQDLRIYFVDLAAANDNDNLVNIIATAAGITDQFTGLNPSDRLSYLAAFLEAKPTLIVFDNCEQIVAAVAAVCESLLATCPTLKVLATSREPLAIIGEAIVRVEPLPVTPAAAMFTSIATMVNPQAMMEADAIIKICRQLDGIPLAIELTAARMRTMTTTEITTHLEQSFHIVAHSRKTEKDRHSTLYTVLEWTWQLLEPIEQQLARRLSALPGGITIESATALLDNNKTTWEVSQLLHSLTDKSLLHPDAVSPQRWRFLTPIRFYLAEKLATDQQEEYKTQLAAAQHFSELAHKCFQQLVHGDQATANQVISTELHNCIASLWFSSKAGLTTLGIQLTLDLSWHWVLHLYLPEIEQWINNPPWRLETVPTPFATAFALLNEALFPQSPTLPDLPLTHELLNIYPVAFLLKWKVHNYHYNRDAALADTHTALTHPDPWIQACGEAVLGEITRKHTDLAEAQHHFKNAYAAFELLNDGYSTAAITIMLAELHSLQGEHEQAITATQAAITLQKTLGFTFKSLTDSTSLATVFLRAGKITEAKQQFLSVLEENQAQHNPIIAVLCHLGLAHSALATGDTETCVYQLHHAQQEMVRPLPDESFIRTKILLCEIQLNLSTGNLTQAQAHFRTLWHGKELATFAKNLPEVIEHASQIFQAKNQPEIAAELLGTATAMRGSFDYGNPTLLHLRAILIAELGLASFDRYYDQGRNKPNISAVLDKLWLSGLCP